MARKIAANYRLMLAASAWACLHCASVAPGGPALTTSRFAATLERPTALAGADLDASACVEIGRERIVRLAYVFPLNELTADELAPDERPARRMRVDFTAADAGLSLLGFLFGVVTETQIAESCDSSLALIAPDELARLRDLSARGVDSVRIDADCANCPGAGGESVAGGAGADVHL